MVMMETNNNSYSPQGLYVNNIIRNITLSRNTRKTSDFCLKEIVEEDGLGDKIFDSGINVSELQSTKESLYDYKEISDLKEFCKGNDVALRDYVKEFPQQPTGSGVITNEEVHDSVSNRNREFREQFCRSVSLHRNPVSNFYFIMKLIPAKALWKKRQQVEIPLAFNDYQWMVKIYGLGKLKLEDEEYAILFMEYLPESSLDKIKLPWPKKTVDLLLRQLLHVIQEMHNFNTVHGDLKLENICRRADGTFVIIDWESAKNPMFPLNFFGTAHYNPPWFSDIVRGNGHEQLKTFDLWAVGIICCQLLNGCLPWLDQCRWIGKEMIDFIRNNHQKISSYYPQVDGPMDEVIRALLPESGRIEDQISVEDALDIIEKEDSADLTPSIFVEVELSVTERKCLPPPTEGHPIQPGKPLVAIADSVSISKGLPTVQLTISVSDTGVLPAVQLTTVSDTGVLPAVQLTTSVSDTVGLPAVQQSTTSVSDTSGLPAVQQSTTSVSDTGDLPAVQQSTTSVSDTSVLPAVQQSTTSVSDTSVLPAVQLTTSVSETSVLPAVQQSPTSVSDTGGLPAVQQSTTSVSNTGGLPAVRKRKLISEDPVPTLSVTINNKVFLNVPVGLKFEQILSIPEIETEINKIKDSNDEFKAGVATWIKIGEKNKFLHGSKICNDSLELVITPPLPYQFLPD